MGSRRLSGAEARQRLQAGGGTATMTKKLLGRRTEEVIGLMAAGDGVMMPAPERQCFSPGVDGDKAHELAMTEHVNKHLVGGLKQVSVMPLS